MKDSRQYRIEILEQACSKYRERLEYKDAEIADLRAQLRDTELLIVENEQLKEQLAALKTGYVMHAILSGTILPLTSKPPSRPHGAL